MQPGHHVCLRTTAPCIYMGQCDGEIRELSEAHVKCMVLSVAWRNVRDKWRELGDA